MKYALLLRDKAVAEIKLAYDWYEEQMIGLGERFLNTVKHNTDLILNKPFKSLIPMALGFTKLNSMSLRFINKP